jgi:hypothetical protein
VPLRMGLYGMADVAQMLARSCLLDAQHQAFIGHLDQPPRLDRHVACQIHAAGIAMPAVEQRGHVDIEDVTLADDPVAGNAVADHAVERDAAAMRIAAIAQRGGHRAPVQRHLPHDVVERASGDAGLHMGHQRVQDFGSEAARLAHAFKGFRAVQLDRGRAGRHRLRGGVHICSHGGNIMAPAR